MRPSYVCDLKIINFRIIMFLIKRNYCNFLRINVISREKKSGDSLGVRGWIKNIRKLKNIIFLDINDGSTSQKFQIVLPKNEATKTITVGSLVKATGKVQVAPNGHYELHAQEVDMIADGHFTEGYPFVPKQQHAPEYIREYLHLRARVGIVAATMRLRHKAQKALHDFMDCNNFVQINTPILTTNDCEGAGEVFTIRPDSKELLKQMSRPDVALENSYFDSKVYLSVSGQLHLESMSYGLGNTYCLGPAFRAENCKSPLHLSEFYMFEAELVYLDDIQQLCLFIERMLKQTVNQLYDQNAEDLEFCHKQNLGETKKFEWINNSWPILRYKEALDIIMQNNDKFKTTITPNEGFSKEQELFLVDYCKSPLFVVDWPADQKPFYMKQSREDPSIVHALDLLMPTVGELCGGSLRESDEQILRNHPHLPQGLEWYLELRKFGGISTGGFGMGFERFLQMLTGVKNIRDVISFPRYPHSCKM